MPSAGALRLCFLHEAHGTDQCAFVTSLPHELAVVVTTHDEAESPPYNRQQVGLRGDCHAHRSCRKIAHIDEGSDRVLSFEQVRR
jgi:hypothetical protein